MKIIPKDNILRILPAAVYDTLEFMALVFGGIGELQDFEDMDADDMGSGDDNFNCPLCVHGMAVAAVTPGAVIARHDPKNPITKALANVGIGRVTNDDAVHAIIVHYGWENADTPFPRVSWADYCTHLNIVRGK